MSTVKDNLEMWRKMGEHAIPWLSNALRKNVEKLQATGGHLAGGSNIVFKDSLILFLGGHEEEAREGFAAVLRWLSNAEGPSREHSQPVLLDFGDRYHSCFFSSWFLSGEQSPELLRRSLDAYSLVDWAPLARDTWYAFSRGAWTLAQLGDGDGLEEWLMKADPKFRPSGWRKTEFEILKSLCDYFRGESGLNPRMEMQIDNLLKQGTSWSKFVETRTYPWIHSLKWAHVRDNLFVHSGDVRRVFGWVKIPDVAIE